jgi:hypothetical protein
MSNTQKPPMKVSEEANRKQLDLAKEQGQAYVKALKHMTEKEAETGGELRVDDYIVGYAVENAEGMYHLMNGSLKWMKPEQENAHIEIAVRDAADHRFVPGLSVRVTVIDQHGREIGTHEQPFLWHPWLYHYGRNWALPGDGEYTLRVHIDPPEFMRHDPDNGKRYPKAVDVEFPKVKIKTGQK